MMLFAGVLTCALHPGVARWFCATLRSTIRTIGNLPVTLKVLHEELIVYNVKKGWSRCVELMVASWLWFGVGIMRLKGAFRR